MPPCEDLDPQVSLDDLHLWARHAPTWEEADRLRATIRDRAEALASEGHGVRVDGSCPKCDATARGYEAIEHPQHYNKGDIEHCEVAEDQGWADGYYAAQITKYIFRAGSKPGASKVEDLKKAAWYAQRWVAWTEKGKAIWKVERKKQQIS